MSFPNYILHVLFFFSHHCPKRIDILVCDGLGEQSKKFSVINNLVFLSLNFEIKNRLFSTKKSLIGSYLSFAVKISNFWLVKFFWSLYQQPSNFCCKLSGKFFFHFSSVWNTFPYNVNIYILPIGIYQFKLLNKIQLYMEI